MERCERVLQLVEQMGATTLAFWNAPAALKLALAKVLEVRPLRLVDVSPGPMLRDELSAAGDYSRRLSLSVADYFARLDCFVAKYEGGQPPELRDDSSNRVRVFPNGVPQVAAGAAAPPPPGWVPELAIGTVCRIVPSKRLEQLVDMMDVLARRIPDATLTIVGAADPWHKDYASYVADKIGRAGLRGIRFVGAHVDVAPFLRSFRVFVMLSDDQGFVPNASLEAMSTGVPVVANDSGGTAEQVLHGINGFIIPTADPVELAGAVEILLRDSGKRQAFGAAARRHVEHEFPIARMVAGYVEAFTGTRCGAGGTRDSDEASACCLTTEDRDMENQGLALPGLMTATLLAGSRFSTRVALSCSGPSLLRDGRTTTSPWPTTMRRATRIGYTATHRWAPMPSEVSSSRATVTMSRTARRVRPRASYCWNRRRARRPWRTRTGASGSAYRAAAATRISTPPPAGFVFALRTTCNSWRSCGAREGPFAAR